MTGLIDLFRRNQANLIPNSSPQAQRLGIFGNELLSEEQNKRANQAGLLRLGLGILEGSQGGGPVTGDNPFRGAIRGLNSGQQAANGIVQSSLFAQQQQQALAQQAESQRRLESAVASIQQSDLPDTQKRAAILGLTSGNNELVTNSFKNESFNLAPNTVRFDAQGRPIAANTIDTDLLSPESFNQQVGLRQAGAEATAAFNENSPTAQLSRQIAEANLNRINQQTSGIEEKRATEAEQKSQAQQLFFDNVTNFKSQVDSLANDPNIGLATGPVDLLLGKFAPGSEQANLQARLDTIRSKSALTALRELKSTGATLGAINEKEFSALENNFVSLQGTQDPVQLQQQLKDFSRLLQQSLDRQANKQLQGRPKENSSNEVIDFRDLQ